MAIPTGPNQDPMASSGEHLAAGPVVDGAASVLIEATMDQTAVPADNPYHGRPLPAAYFLETAANRAALASQDRTRFGQ